MKSARVLAVIAGTSLAPVVACSDPPSEPAQGAVTVVVGGTGSGPQCQFTHGQLTLPADTRVYDELMTCDLSAGCKPSAIVAVNRTEGADVQCSVKPAGDKFQVSLYISKQPYLLLQATGQVSATGGTLSIVESSEAGGGTPISDGACTITVEANRGLVKPGAIWARFKCDHAIVRGDPSGAECSVEGAFIFENCDS